MIGGIGIEVLGATEAARKIGDLPRVLRQAETRAVNAGRIEAEAVWKRKVRGDVLKVRSGEYRAAIHSNAPEESGGRIEAKVGIRQGPASPYAAIHETGGPISPKNGQYLTIPLPALRTKAGVARSKSPRDFPGGFFFESKAGRLLFAIRQGLGMIPLFVLKHSVFIPKRRPMGQTYDEVAPKVVARFRDEVAKATKRAGE